MHFSSEVALERIPGARVGDTATVDADGSSPTCWRRVHAGWELIGAWSEDLAGTLIDAAAFVVVVRGDAFGGKAGAK